jgi:hypothetical protein
VTPLSLGSSNNAAKSAQRKVMAGPLAMEAAWVVRRCHDRKNAAADVICPPRSGVAQEEIATDDVWITERTDRRIAVVANSRRCAGCIQVRLDPRVTTRTPRQRSRWG